MIQENHYINIPSLEEIKVSNYSLFKKNWEYKFSEGTNVFIGANGLGKTTSTSLIIYAIVGYTANIDSSEFKIDNDYFSSRSDNKNSEDAEIEISFKIKDNLFLIKRKLYLDNISYYSLDGTEKDVSLYKDDLVKLSKLSLSDLAFILEKFLIREEEGNYLLWNFRDQSKLLQLLINPVGFKKVYEEKSIELSKLTTEINRKRDTDVQSYNKRITEIQELRNKDKYTDNREKVTEKINVLHKTLKKKNTQKEKKLEQYKETLKVFSGLKQNIDKINFDIELKNEEILDLEQTFYKTVYSDKKVLNTIHKMRNYGICTYCDSRLKSNIKIKVLEKIDKGNCPVCEEKVSTHVHTNGTNNSINYIQTLELEIKNLIERKTRVEKQKEPNSNKIQALNLDLKNLNEEIDNLGIEIYENELNINASQNKKDYNQYDIEIKNLRGAIDKIKKELEPKENRAKTLAKELEMENTKLSKTIVDNLNDINTYFKEYSFKYFRDDCELRIEQKQLKKSNNFERIRQSHYVPFFDNKSRTLTKHCSTSQRIFLEYLFRISLLKLYNKISENKNSPFAIFETSEGAFDLKFTNKLAQAFLDFNSHSSITLVLIVNMSKPAFVKTIIKGIKDSSKVLNYIEFGRMDDETKKFYTTELKKII